MAKKGGHPERRTGEARDAGGILPQNSGHLPVKNVQIECILLRAGIPGNPAS
ncbi:hypothetical protein [Burkholderia pseudomultivorans]|uniref:hypothetical protein n=1 Tax=Burkholderia pseudomultivorans TaxID=1207504 RepID=UPI00158389FA|nr:hypothetical protein [Burkholderia pseudomultivorans]